MAKFPCDNYQICLLGLRKLVVLGGHHPIHAGITSVAPAR